jgi:hypothetical protein
VPVITRNDDSDRDGRAIDVSGLSGEKPSVWLGGPGGVDAISAIWVKEAEC